MVDSMETRRNAIANLVDEKGSVSFSMLKEEFPNVSEMTLRTDLKSLDEEKRILRVHGGAKSVQFLVGTDDLLTRKSFRNVAEKKDNSRKSLKSYKTGKVSLFRLGQYNNSPCKGNTGSKQSYIHFIFKLCSGACKFRQAGNIYARRQA